MTDKQVIIDGVDVSKCEHNYNKNLGEYSTCNLYPPPLNCKRHPNCLFKQLARKTQECENWKETANQYVKNEEYYKSQVDKYKAENEKAEQEREALQMSDNEAREIVAELKAECEELKVKIRYMEEYIKTVENSRNEFEKENSFLKRILQGINEVSNDRQEQ